MNDFGGRTRTGTPGRTLVDRRTQDEIEEQRRADLRRPIHWLEITPIGLIPFAAIFRRLKRRRAERRHAEYVERFGTRERTPVVSGTAL